jgi:hypothetical protein
VFLDSMDPRKEAFLLRWEPIAIWRHYGKAIGDGYGKELVVVGGEEKRDGPEIGVVVRGALVNRNDTCGFPASWDTV